MEFKYRRAPAVFRTIAKIDPLKDIRVRLFGRIAEKLNQAVILEDSTGKAEIKMDSQTLESLNIGEAVRIFCRVLQTDAGYELNAELIQDMNNLDRELYEKIFLNQ